MASLEPAGMCVRNRGQVFSDLARFAIANAPAITTTHPTIALLPSKSNTK
jgi:hypothetical protein